MDAKENKQLLFALILTIGIIIGGSLVILVTQPKEIHIDCKQAQRIAETFNANDLRNLSVMP